MSRLYAGCGISSHSYTPLEVFWPQQTVTRISITTMSC
jgi:hypothetical protein